jgi:hypothetical protein
MGPCVIYFPSKQGGYPRQGTHVMTGALSSDHFQSTKIVRSDATHRRNLWALPATSLLYIFKFPAKKLSTVSGNCFLTGKNE